MLVNTYKKTVEQSTVDSSSMPTLIEMIQYITGWEAYKMRIGNLGDHSNYSYSLLFDTENITSGSNIDKLKNILLNKSYVNISKNDIFDMFYVYEVPDYGANALTTGMTDFDVECYSNAGNRVIHSAIAILKSFTLKKAYVLVDKRVVVENPMTMTIILEPKAFYNPYASNTETREPYKATVEPYILSCTKLDGNKFCFIVDDKNDKNHNKSASFITNILDYDLCYIEDKQPTSSNATSSNTITVSENTVVYRIPDSAYEMYAQNILEFIASYTNYQTYNGSLIEEYTRIPRDENSNDDNGDYRGDYFKQVQTALINMLEGQQTYGPNTLSSRKSSQLAKFIPYVKDRPNSTVIIAEIRSNYITTNSKQQKKIITKNIFLSSRQNFNKYIYYDTSIDGKSIHNIKIGNDKNLEIFAYEKVDGSIGYKNGVRIFPTYTLSNKELTITYSSKKYARYEVKIYGDNKRHTEIMGRINGNNPSPIDNIYRINAAKYLLQRRILAYNINLSKCSIRIYDDAGKYYDYSINNNIIEVKNISDKDEKFHIIIRDYSPDKYQLYSYISDNTSDDNGSFTLSDIYSEEYAAKISDALNQFDPSTHITLGMAKNIYTDTASNVEVYPYNADDKYYMAIRDIDEPVIHVQNKTDDLTKRPYDVVSIIPAIPRKNDTFDADGFMDKFKFLTTSTTDTDVTDSTDISIIDLENDVNNARLSIKDKYEDELQKVKSEYILEFLNSDGPNKLIELDDKKIKYKNESIRYIILTSTKEQQLDYILYDTYGDSKKKKYQETGISGYYYGGKYYYVIIPTYEESGYISLVVGDEDAEMEYYICGVTR